MASYDFDLITLGAGSGGVAASKKAGFLGARVALCESDRIGGTCVLRGCVPKKLLVYGASFAAELADAAGFGWDVPAVGQPGGPRLDWQRLQQQKDRELDRLNGVYKRVLADAGVVNFSGRARLRDAHTVTVGDTTLTGRHILVATGGWPARPAIPGRELGITSNEALSLPELPRRLVVIGGGYIAMEMAGIFHAVGTEVTVLVRGDLPLRGFDDDARAHLSAQLADKGLRILPRSQASSIEATADGLAVLIEGGEPLYADRVLLATGRVPNTDGIGLDEVGVRRDELGAVAVDDYMCTSVPNIYAIGDCTDRLNLTPAAIAEGRAVAETLFGKGPTPIRHGLTPTAVFSSPPLGSVGLTEAEARAQFPDVEIYATTFRPMKNNLSGRAERTFMKLVVDRVTGRVLGCHMVGVDAPEIIQGLAVALTAGATKADFDRTLALHPTAAEEFVLLREPRRPAKPASR